MATVTHAATATWSTTGGNTTNVATPAVGDLIVVIAPSTGVATSAVTDRKAAGGGTYTLKSVPRSRGSLLRVT